MRVSFLVSIHKSHSHKNSLHWYPKSRCTDLPQSELDLMASMLQEKEELDRRASAAQLRLEACANAERHRQEELESFKMCVLCVLGGRVADFSLKGRGEREQ